MRSRCGRAVGGPFGGDIADGWFAACGCHKEMGMLCRDQTMDIILLHKQGHSIRDITRQSGHSRNTVRRAVREGAPHVFQTPPRPSKLDPFKDYLRQRFEEHGLSGRPG